MESKNELKKIDIKNRTCYYFDGKIRNFSDMFLNERSYKRSKNVLI